MCLCTVIEAYSQEIGEKESFSDHSLMINLGLIGEFIVSDNMEGRLRKAAEQWFALCSHQLVKSSTTCDRRLPT